MKINATIFFISTYSLVLLVAAGRQNSLSSCDGYKLFRPARNKKPAGAGSD